jgi:hypothetical protein
MNENNLTLQLKDIKPLLDIPDSSFYYYWGLIGFVLVLVLGIVFFLLKKWWQNRQVNMAKVYLAKLKAIEWDDSKHAAYEATKYARLLATDERREKLFVQLEAMLQPYKYKKEVQKVDSDTLNHFNLYVQVSDESI